MKPVIKILIGAAVITGALFFLNKFVNTSATAGSATDPGAGNDTDLPVTGPMSTEKVNVVIEAPPETSLFPKEMWNETGFQGIQFGKLG